MLTDFTYLLSCPEFAGFKSALSLQQTPERVSAHLSPGLKPPAEEEDPNNKTRRNVFSAPSQRRDGLMTL